MELKKETAKKNPIKVLITSIDAGGGHKELKNNFQRTLTINDNITTLEYHSDAKVFNIIYSFLARRVPYAYKLVHRFGMKPKILKALKPLTNLPEQKGLELIIKMFQPDIILSCYFTHTILSVSIRKKTKGKFKIVSILPDYCDKSGEVHLTAPADFYLVRDEDTKMQLHDSIPKESVFVFGTTVNDIFKDVKNLPIDTLKAEFDEFVNEYVDHKSVKKHRPNILIMGGSGWTYKSRFLIKKMAATGKYNIFVSCGKDMTLYEDICETENINAFQFIDQNTLAIVERYCEAAILSSIAPATLNELLEINKYPILVHRYIFGQETSHLKIIKDWGVGSYQPNDTAMMALVDDLIANPAEYEPMLAKGRAIRNHENEKALKNADLIESIYNTNFIES